MRLLPDPREIRRPSAAHQRIENAKNNARERARAAPEKRRRRATCTPKAAARYFARCRNPCQFSHRKLVCGCTYMYTQWAMKKLARAFTCTCNTDEINMHTRTTGERRGNSRGSARVFAREWPKWYSSRRSLFCIRELYARLTGLWKLCGI